MSMHAYDQRVTGSGEHPVLVLQACQWTGACATYGCEYRCLVNQANAMSYMVLMDRVVREDSYHVCPLLAFNIAMLKSLGSAVTSGRRRLQQQEVRILNTGAGEGIVTANTVSCSCI